MTENFDEIEKRIIKVLDDFLIEAEENKYIGNKIWTNRLKESIGDLGIELNYEVAIGGFLDKFEREWLYDIVWYQEDPYNRLIRIPLIVESEWDRNYLGIKYDFEKLLIGNAEKRLMICQSKSNQVERLFIKFKEAINTFEENYNDRFLIAIFDSDTESNFYYKTFTKH
ncbi:hypothetical protein HDE69_001940 [Pedobacter cryoconitis]|uniref:Uncharacterized protein n=1 Tax=Pedobacter cryoconitis TaxID=188932 RepID=A0A7W9DJ68_9SPHI|nr:hypothetical protein [Pedobacter cryoconitis]MBB5620887.1 hypothetical protein [Pedobacter cryoconitis]